MANYISIMSNIEHINVYGDDNWTSITNSNSSSSYLLCRLLLSAGFVFVYRINNEWITNSIEDGSENPFRPDGELSKEADEIVNLIKGN